MFDVLNYLYNLWGLAAAISTAFGIFSALIVLKKMGKNLFGKSRGFRILAGVTSVVCVIILIFSCVVGALFTKVPNVRNITVSEADQLLMENDLQLFLPAGMNKDDETFAKLVVNQDPLERSVVLKGTNVVVYIAFTVNTPTQNFVDVPSLIGKRYLDALEMLNESGLRFRISSSVDKNISTESAYIVSQSIAAGSSVPESSLIDLELSENEGDVFSPPTSPSTDFIVVPDVVNMEEQEAVKTMEGTGLTTQVWWLEGTDESLESYYIISQSIPAGSTVPKGTLIELERSSIKRGEPVVVPNVVGMEQKDATILLTNMGLQFQVWWKSGSDSPNGSYYIFSQDIPEGSTVPAGTLVRLGLSPTKP